MKCRLDGDTVQASITCLVYAKTPVSHSNIVIQNNSFRSILSNESAENYLCGASCFMGMWCNGNTPRVVATIPVRLRTCPNNITLWPLKVYVCGAGGTAPPPQRRQTAGTNGCATCRLWQTAPAGCDAMGAYRAFNPRVVGSSPTAPIILYIIGRNSVWQIIILKFVHGPPSQRSSFISIFRNMLPITCSAKSALPPASTNIWNVKVRRTFSSVAVYRAKTFTNSIKRWRSSRRT